MEIKTLKTKLAPANYYAAVYPKKYIFLHHTSGHSAESAVQWWNVEPSQQHVAAAFVIERDGTVYRTFDEKYWAYALGLKGGTAIEKASIHIEIVAKGQLKLEGDKFYFKPSSKSKYEVPDEEVHAYVPGFRGEEFFHKYTKEQIRSTIQLISYLVEKHNIPMSRQINGLFCEFAFFEKNLLPGLYSHTSVRSSGKWDIHPQPDMLNALITLHQNNYKLAL